MSRLTAVLSSFVLLLLAAAVPAHASADTCDLYAGPFGSDTAAGTLSAPFHSVQHLSDALAPGQTGCLFTGTYSDVISAPYVLRVNHGGTATARITIRSAPNNSATLKGITYVATGSDFVTLSGIHFIGQRAVPDKTTGVQVTANDTIIEDSEITDNNSAICMVLGTPGWAPADRTIVRRNVFHDCGGRENNKEHSVYVDWADHVQVHDNVFLRSGEYAVHMYPYATNTTVTHNVMVDGGGGAIFGGVDGSPSSNNVVTQNIITGTVNRPGIHSWFGDQLGSNNLAANNCLYNNFDANVDTSGGGFTATGNVIANPLFRDPAHGDYRLSPNSPCLAIVGYDTVARLDGDPDPVAVPTATATATAIASATGTSTPAPTSTRTPAPTQTQTQTATPAQTAAPTRTATPPATATPSPTAAAATPTVPPVSQEPVAGSPAQAPTDPVEAAHEIDAQAFSYSGGTPVKPKARKHRR